MYSIYKRYKNLCRLCVAVFCFFTLSLVCKAEEGRTVRVGLFQKEGYHSVDEHGHHSGYDYEYLTALAGYTNWKYEYVEGTWAECLERLKNGEIDLLGGVEKTETRLYGMHFSVMPSMYASACLLGEAESSAFSYEDFEAFDGMRIGMMNGSSIDGMLQQYAKQHAFSYTPMWYDTEDELKKALSGGEIDAICLSDNRDLSGYQVLGSFGYFPLYYVTNPSETELAAQLDEALEEIHAHNHYFESSLSERYFESAVKIAFTQEEQAYIAQAEPVHVVLYRGVSDLFCRYDENANTYCGIAIDALDLIAQRTGLTFVYEELPEQTYPREYLQEHKNVVIAPYMTNSLISISEGLEVLDPIVKGRMTAVSRKGNINGLDDSFRLALPAGIFSMKDKLAAKYPNAELVPCVTHREGLELVRNGGADRVLVNEIAAAYLLQSPYFHDLIARNTEITEDMTLALNDGSDPELISVLNKAIASISERDSRQIVVNNTAATSYAVSAQEWMYENRAMLLLIAVFLIWIVIVIWREARIRQRKAADYQQMIRAEARSKADQEYREKMFAQASFDELTGLYNQHYFVERTTGMMEADPKDDYIFFRINLEKFAMVNESYGNEAGDEMLRQIADMLRRDLKGRGVYGRLYADQFAICIPGAHSDLSRAKKEGVYFFDYKGQKIRVQMNVGVYISKAPEHDARRALDYAQMALQNGRAESGGHFFCFKEEYLQTMLENQEISNTMEQALREGQFKVYLQPQFDIAYHRLVGAEALVRWEHPTRGLVSPARFIPVFEANNFIYQLDSYVCGQVCKILARWMERGKIVPVSINLSQVDLLNPQLTGMLQSNLERYHVPVQYLHLEITESVYAENQTMAKQVIAKLRSLGFCIEMDDFGSGYSSLNMLKDIPVDVLKMDMRFFEGETHMERGGNIIEAIVKLAHSLGLIVIAEGVETERESNFLRSIQCSISQGFLYGRPVPVREFEAYLAVNDIGRKVMDVRNDDSIRNLYWKMEKYDILLRSGQVMLLDYDALQDYAVFTQIDRDGKRQETAMIRYTETLEENIRIHPDDRARLKQAILRRTKQVETMEFRADRDGRGFFDRYRLDLYHYENEQRAVRVIAAMKRI